MKRFSFFASDGIRWILLAIILVVALWMQFSVYAAMPAVFLTLLLMRFYYDPDRNLPSHPLGVMSPVDGTIIECELFYDPFIDRTAQRIRIQSELFGVYHSRSPTEGKMMEYWPALKDDTQGYSPAETRGVWWIQTDEGDNLIIAVMAKSGWWLTKCDVQIGERVGQARRCGRFPPNNMVDILLGENTFIEAVPGQHVKAGTDLIATFNHDVESTEQ